jgi:predicted secreted hydrolase
MAVCATANGLPALASATPALRWGAAKCGSATGASTQQENSQGNRYQARVHGEDFAYDLALDATAPPLLNGRDGFSSKAADPRHASYYYSRPQLAVSGSVSLQGRAEAVSGHAWLDHEWSSELLPDGAQGWDWVGINLADGSALMAFRLRDTSGNPQWAAGSLRSTGKIDQIFASGGQFLPVAPLALTAHRH